MNILNQRRRKSDKKFKSKQLNKIISKYKEKIKFEKSRKEKIEEILA